MFRAWTSLFTVTRLGSKFFKVQQKNHNHNFPREKPPASLQSICLADKTNHHHHDHSEHHHADSEHHHAEDHHHHHGDGADPHHNIHNEVDHEHEIQALESSIESVYASFDGSEDVEHVYSGSYEDEVSYNVIEDDSLEELDRSRYSLSCLLSSVV